MYCVYLTSYSGNKLPPFYIGYTTLKNIFKGYRGTVSSAKYKNVWLNELSSHPELFKTFVISKHTNHNDAVAKEHALQSKLNVLDNPLYINQGVWPIFNKNKPQPNKGKKYTEASKIKIAIRALQRPKTLCIKCKEYYDATNYKRWHGDKCSGKKTRARLTDQNERIKKLQERLAEIELSKPPKIWIWINNGHHDRRVPLTEEHSYPGYKRGRRPTNRVPWNKGLKLPHKANWKARGRKASEEEKQKRRDKRWVTNDIVTLSVHKSEVNTYLAQGYRAGRANITIKPKVLTEEERKRMREGCARRHSNPANKEIWVTDLSKTLRIKQSELQSYLDKGFVCGRTLSDQHKKAVALIAKTRRKVKGIGSKGKIWITNGSENLLVNDADLQNYSEKGYRRGRTYLKNKNG